MQTDENVDLSEIAKFEKLASRWWDPHSEFKPLHDINPLRAGWIDQHANVKHKNVLDVGCGGGLLCEALAHRGALVTGIDMGEAPLSVARLHQLESGVTVDYQQSTAESMAERRAGEFERSLHASRCWSTCPTLDCDSGLCGPVQVGGRSFLFDD